MEGCREKEIESLPMSRLAINLDRRSDRLPKTTPWAKPVAFVISFT
jgi:hypothetical protein